MAAEHCLVLETSTPHASIALGDLHGVSQQRSFHSDRNHNALLFAPLQEVIQSADGISLVLVGSGPGSYGGTRVGIAAAQGVAIALGCPAVAVPSVLAVPSARNGAACLAIGDARRGSYWTVTMGNFRLGSAPQLCDAEKLAEAIANAAANDVPVVSFEDPSRFPLPAELATIVRLEFPDAERLWQAWQGADEDTRSSWSAEIPQPLYLKPPHITPAKRPWLVKPC
jgi:tRNA threonylcarbamoyl adenosine modification protein YeaZ